MAVSKKKSIQEQHATVDAAALQDHWIRSLGLHKPSIKRVPRGVSYGTNDDLLPGFRGTWICDRPRAVLNRKLTLAQQRGLVASPISQSSQNEWVKCESRAEKRGHFLHPCAICRDHLGIQEQIILSCSHVFHRTCFRSFERFSKSSQQVCPLCRKAGYRKKVTSKGTDAFIRLCATRLQATIRGYLERKKLYSLLKEYYASGKGDASLRKKFLAERVECATKKVLEKQRFQEDTINRLFAEFDRTLDLSQRVLSSYGLNDEKPERGDNRKKDEKYWEGIFEKAVNRDEKECSICMYSFSSQKYLIVLSCSHIFHHNCLDSFEKFNTHDVFVCPLCRMPYTSQVILNLKKREKRHSSATNKFDNTCD